ncbi:unnamed protein product, partial [Prorocentrum cordatum]
MNIRMVEWLSKAAGPEAAGHGRARRPSFPVICRAARAPEGEAREGSHQPRAPPGAFGAQLSIRPDPCVLTSAFSRRAVGGSSPARGRQTQCGQEEATGAGGRSSAARCRSRALQSAAALGSKQIAGRGWDPVKSEVLRDVKSCKNIIRFEKLHADFNSLMEKRGYPYRLTAKKSMPSLQCTTTLRREDFSPRAKELVYQIYRD